MISNRKVLIIALFISALAIPACSKKNIVINNSDEHAAETSLVTVDIDWASFLARHDLVWTRLPTEWYEAPFLGNGLLGTQIRRKSDTSIRFDIGRSDVQERRPLSEGGAIFARSRLPIGHFSLDTAGKIVGGDLRLGLHDAEVTGTIKTDKGGIQLRCFVHTDEMLLIVEAKPDGGEAGCRFQFHPEEAVAPRMNTKRRLQEGYVPNPPFVLSKVGAVRLCTQNLLRGGQTATAWRAASKGDILTLRASVAHTPRQANAYRIALETIQRTERIPVNDLLSSHRRWWHNYYTESFISLSDTYWESFYWIQMYKLASATRENRGLLDNQGPWLQPTPWAGAWWNLNVQLSYWPTITSNRLHLTESLLERLDNHTQALIDAVPEPYRHDSAGIGRVTGQELVSGISYPLGVPGQDKAEVGSLPWALHDYWLAYRASMDDQRLREKLFPLLKRSINYYLHFLETGDDGKLHLPTTYSPEYGSGPDCNYDLALLRWGCQTLLRICKRLKIDDPLIPKWQNVLANLTDYPVDKNGYMIARGIPFAKGHRHFSHLLMCYPLYLETVEKPGAKELAFKSVKHWHSLGSSRGYSLTGASSISSAYGDGNAALKYLNGLRPYLQASTMYKEAGPVIETPLAGAQSIHDMLLQSWGDRIRVFPAVADAWPNVVFHNLRAEGAFLVSAMRRDGKTRWVRIRSLAGEPCKVMPNLAEPVRVAPNTTSVLTPLGHGVFEISLARNDEIILYTGDELSQLKVLPLVPQQGQTNIFGLK